MEIREYVFSEFECIFSSCIIYSCNDSQYDITFLVCLQKWLNLNCKTAV